MPQKIVRAPGRPKKTESPDYQTKELILRTASAQFMKVGFERVSLGQIAQNCGVTKATVYYYFGNKANLFTEAFRTILENVKNRVLELLKQDKSLLDKLTDIAAERMKHMHGDFETLMKEADSSLTMEQITEIRTAEREIHAVMADCFREAMECGILAKENPLLLSHMFAALLMIGNNRAFTDEFANHEEAASAVVHVFWHGASQRR